MKKKLIIFIVGLLSILIFSLIRRLAGFTGSLEWYWVVIIIFLSYQLGKYFYYIIFGANIDQIDYRNKVDNQQLFEFKFNPHNLKTTEIGHASFDLEAYPELLNSRTLQIILFGQTTRKEIIELINSKNIKSSIKKYKHRGKTYEITFYPSTYQY